MRHDVHQVKTDGCLSSIDGRTLKAKRIEDLVPVDAGSPGRHALEYLHALEAKGYSRHTLRSRSAHLRYFLVWLHAAGHYNLRQISPEILTHYSLSVHRHGCRTGRPLSAHSRYDRIANVHRFMKWLNQRGVLTDDPTIGIDRPRCRRRLPKTILTAAEAEKVLAQPDVSSPLGLRDRAILETLYATGLRRQELIDLDLGSIDLARGTLSVRLGKGGKDRVVPFGARTTGWIRRYLKSSRPALLRGTR
ncbi:MAG: tyrosine-type recombinase/integrase, partial [Thermoanaerobaculales bacterium]|nr:tyrosine-type recombinase/integrase [Thermoanaerobaculales bacterium]